ncbi:4Fe-4S binding protein [Bradyrhizobium sp. AZCC 1693]|uniref:4Fe-4S binding protein n=1 Tax=Bradyrhizobium sp. AZCC 1693 TaxID=3117029 RepID=UPI002FF12ED3
MALTIEINHAKTRAKAAAASGQPVMPQAVNGRIRRIKWIVLLLTLSIYYVTPFLRWDRGPNAPDQAVLLDFAHGRLYAFFIEIWPQDLYLVTGLLVLASTSLILTNALAGRLWCGFACPQTVWTDLFLLVEGLIEGDRRQRSKNFGAPLDAERAMQIVAKHAAWILISLATGGTLIFYFTDAPELLRSFAHGDVSATHICGTRAMANITVSPGRSGPVEVLVQLEDGDEKPLVADALSVTLSNPDKGIASVSATAERMGADSWRVRLTAAASGKWSLSLGIDLAKDDRVDIAAPILIE